MEITWLGHSAVIIKGTKTVVIDPFLTGNPVAAVTPDEIAEADVVVVTHDHGDHKGDAFDICKKTGATLVSVHEVAVQGEAEGIPSEGMNIGGTIESNGVIVGFNSCCHSCSRSCRIGGIRVDKVKRSPGFLRVVWCGRCRICADRELDRKGFVDLCSSHTVLVITCQIETVVAASV